VALLERRRLKQRIAHARGEELDTWKKKGGVVEVAQAIQVCLGLWFAYINRWALEMKW
jgi:hypothetical protein